MSFLIHQQTLYRANGFTLLSATAKTAWIQRKPQVLHIGALRDLSTPSAHTNLWRSTCSSTSHHKSFNALHHISCGRYLPQHVGSATTRTFSHITRRSAPYRPPSPWAPPPFPEPVPSNVTSPRVASIVTKGIIAFCTLIYLARIYSEAVLDPHAKFNVSPSTVKLCKRIREITDQYFVVSTETERSHQVGSVLGYTFMHASMLHLGVNMFVLNSFAPTVIMQYGLFRAFLPLWFLAACAGGIAFIRWQQVNQPRSGQNTKDVNSESFLGIKPTPETRAVQHNFACGASTVLSGFLGFLFTAGHRGMTVGLPLVPLGIPLSVATLGYAAFEYWALSTGSIPNLGHAGHLGGMIGGAMFGVIFRLPLLRRRRLV